MGKEYSKFDVWKEHENIAMHFNGLLMQLRLRALAAVGFIVTIGGIFAKNQDNGVNWALLSVILFIVLLAWISTYVIDRFYYNKLLTGSVKAIVELEKLDDGSGIPILASTVIEKEFSNEKQSVITVVNWFYGLTFFGILSLLIGSIAQTETFANLCNCFD